MGLSRIFTVLANLVLLTFAHTDNVPKSTNGDIFTTGIQLPNCSVKTEESKLRRKMAEFVDEGKKLIFVRVSFTDHENPIPDNYTGNMYKPMEWVRTYGRHGRSLLFLRPQFEHLSLTTLSYDTARLNITFTQTPTRCLTSQNVSMIEKNLRRLLVLDSKMSEKEDGIVENEYVCNRHIHNEDYHVVFRYVCCHDHERTMEHLHCDEMKNDFWMDVLFFIVFLIKILVILLCPLLIPESVYRKKYAAEAYEHRLMNPIQIKIKRVTEIDSSGSDMPVVSIEKLKGMQTFFHAIKGLPINKVTALSLNKLDIKVRHDRLVPPNYVPVGIFQIFYTMFVKCHIRKTPSFTRCCRGSIIGNGLKVENTVQEVIQLEDENDKEKKHDTCSLHEENKASKPKYPWYKCLQQFMRFLILLACSIPWIIRVYFFYKYEASEVLDETTVADKRNLTLPPFKWNLTYSLTPVHPMFLICYIIILIDALVFVTVNTKIKKKLQYVLRKSLRDMREMSRSKALEWSVVVLLLPCEICGIFGFILSVFYFILVLPVAAITLAFYCLPTVNLTIRLFAHLLVNSIPFTGACCKRQKRIKFKKRCKTVYELFHFNILSSNEKNEDMSLKNRCIQLMILVASLLTVFAFVFLTLEILIFFIEMLLYTVIGIIMNATEMLKYISLIFMLVLYARDCFKGVTDKYLKFNKTINNLIVDMNRAKVEEIANASVDEQQNAAFQICSENDNIANENSDDGQNISLITKDGIPKWGVRRLILFLDKYDQPYLTEKFFFQVCYMNTIGAPGALIPNILRAAWRFLCICAFLLFVVLIVLAFGDEYNISGTNQMLATLAGGFLPWVFSNILFKPRDPVPLDVNNLSFKSNFKTIIEEYTQNWDIHDIKVTEDVKMTQSNKEKDLEVSLNSDKKYTTNVTKDESIQEGFPDMLSESSSMMMSDCSCSHEPETIADSDLHLIVVDKNPKGQHV